MTATRSNRSGVAMGVMCSQSKWCRADEMVGFELRDLGVGEAEIAEDLVVVLAEHRRRRAQPVVDARVPERDRRMALHAHDGMVEVFVVPTGDELRVLRCPAGVVRGRGGNTRADEQVD